MQKEEFAEIVHYGTLAPSPHNNQPWRFETEGNSVRVYLVPERVVMMGVEVTSRESYISLGCVAENMTVAAAQLGYATDVQILPDGADSELAATLTFSTNGVSRPGEGIFEALTGRCNNRARFDGSPLSEEEQSRIRGILDEGKDVLHYNLLVDRDRIREIAGWVATGDRMRFQMKALHSELYLEWLRFSVEETCKTRDGMPLSLFNIPTFLYPISRHLMKWGPMKFLGYFGYARILGWMYGSSLARTASAFSLICARRNDRESFIRCGLYFQRLCLAIQAMGLSHHIQCSIPGIVNIVRHNPAPPMSKGQIAEGQKMKQWLWKTLELPEGVEPIVAFRIGRGPTVKIRALRRQVDQVLTCKEGSA